MERNLSRRSVLGVGVAATAAAATVGPGAAVAALADPNDPRSSTESVGEFRRLEAVSAVAPGEQVLYITAASMTPNSATAGTTSIIFGNGWLPSGGSATFRYLSTSINVPLGSTLTNIEWVVNGNPQAGRVALLRWVPDTGAAFVPLASTDLPATIGRTVYSVAIPTPAGSPEVFNGTQTYEAYYRVSGATDPSSGIEGVRVRYLPPSNELVPITPVRVYDSRLNMVPDANGVLASGSNRTVSVASARDVTTGVATGTAVPANATAIAYTLTVADTTAQGFLAVNPGGNTVVSASSINWKAASQEIANTGVVKLGPNRTITAVAGGGGTTNFIIDIVGYYL